MPQLLSAVHLLMEEDTSTCFILTGSSARKLKRTGVDLLAGRAVLCTMHSFMACELGSSFDLDKALQLGTIPLVFSSEEPEKKSSTYVSVYLQEEVKHEGLVRKIGDFSRFLEIISFSHGAEINASNIARECGIGRKAVESYIGITQDLLLSYTLPAFVKKSERAPASHPKFYFFDCGIYQSLRPKGPLDRPQEIAGPALEGLVAQHLRAYLAYANQGRLSITGGPTQAPRLILLYMVRIHLLPLRSKTPRGCAPMISGDYVHFPRSTPRRNG